MRLDTTPGQSRSRTLHIPPCQETSLRRENSPGHMAKGCGPFFIPVFSLWDYFSWVKIRSPRGSLLCSFDLLLDFETVHVRSSDSCSTHAYCLSHFCCVFTLLVVGNDVHFPTSLVRLPPHTHDGRKDSRSVSTTLRHPRVAFSEPRLQTLSTQKRGHIAIALAGIGFAHYPQLVLRGKASTLRTVTHFGIQAHHRFAAGGIYSGPTGSFRPRQVRLLSQQARS